MQGVSMKRKCQILFSEKDPFGENAGSSVNFWKHMEKKGSYFGADHHVRPLFPRGRAYWRMTEIQLEVASLKEESLGF